MTRNGLYKRMERQEVFLLKKTTGMPVEAPMKQPAPIPIGARILEDLSYINHTEATGLEFRL